LSAAGDVRAEPPGEDPGLQREIDMAIDAGVKFLLKAVQGPSGWTPMEVPPQKFPSGYAALQVYALVKSDVSYRHPVVQEGIQVMERHPLSRVYTASVRILAYDAILNQIDTAARLGETRRSGDRSRYLSRLKKDLDWLMGVRLKGVGAWDYGPVAGKEGPAGSRYDHSNTQFAVLALGVAAERRLSIQRQVWEEILDHFVKVQDPDGKEVQSRPIFQEDVEGDIERDGVVKRRKKRRKGSPTVGRKTGPLYEGEAVQVKARGWRYLKDEAEIILNPNLDRQFSMVCAGLSSLLLAQRYLPPNVLAGHRGEALKRALRDGYGWITSYVESGSRPLQYYYALYSLEKVGDIGKVVAFGSHRWYEKYSREILAQQGDDGGWGETKNIEPQYAEALRRQSTSFALLFLGRATDLEARSRPLVRATGAGGGPGRKGKSERPAWIYLPSQKGEVPLVRLFRLFKYRPSKQVLKMVEEAVEVYDPERLHEIVELLVEAHRDTRYAPVQTLSRELLVKTTGLELAEMGSYGEWAARWGEVLQIGKKQDRNRIGDLRNWLDSSRGIPLKKKVIWALQRTGAKVALGQLIDLMENPDADLREAAYQAVTFLSGESLPFHSRGSDQARAGEIQAWREWRKRAGPAAE